MIKTGRLEIDHNSGTSRLNAGPGDRKRLARNEGGSNPFKNATNFLVSQRGLDIGDFIFVTGDEGTHSGAVVIFITDAGLAQDAAEVLSAAEAATRSVTTKRSTAEKRRPTQKAGKKSSKKVVRKRTTKSGKKANKK